MYDDTRTMVIFYRFILLGIWNCRSQAEVLVPLSAGVPRSQLQAFRLTIGNPAVSPPVNVWTFLGFGYIWMSHEMRKKLLDYFVNWGIIPSHPANPVVDASFTFQQSLFRFSDLKPWSHSSEVGSKIRKYYLGFGPSNCRLPGSLQLQHFLSRALEKMDPI